MNRCKVYFKHEDLTIEVSEGTTVMDAINEAGLGADFPCGGRGRCGKCRVVILEGVEEPTDREREYINEPDLAQGVRLACLTKIYNDISVELPLNRKLQHNILIDSEAKELEIDPHLKKIFIEVKKPVLETQRSDWHRLKDSLTEHGYNPEDLSLPLDLLRRLPQSLRKSGHRLTAVMYGSQVLGLEEQDTTGTMLGMAFDIGTTTIVGYLLDLYTGKELSVVSTLNPQAKYGADVISRISFASGEEGLEKLHDAVKEAINELVAEAAKKAGVDSTAIYAVSIAANTCMHHLFLGINPRTIGVSPYVSTVSEPWVTDANDLGIKINAAGKIFVLPNIAGFVGADTTAVLLAADLERSEDIKLIIDIGTNGEIVLGSREKIAACSAAAGPAFEGAQISSGMRGAVGAIDHVYFGDRLDYSVIGGGAPQGICGSALLDTVAGMIESGIIDKRGRILSPDMLTDPKAAPFKENLVQYDRQMAFLLAAEDKTSHGRPIMVTQNDIRELQLAKGAMAAGVRILMETCGVESRDIKEVLLAGAFGNYLNPHSACVIGLIPAELEGRIKMIGNAAGTGARLALLSSDRYHYSANLASSVQFVELGSYPQFNNIFAESMYFKNR